MDTDMAALWVIQESDPDGGQVEPTDAMYLAHETWAVGRFGREVWERYRRGGWGPSEDW